MQNLTQSTEQTIRDLKALSQDKRPAGWTLNTRNTLYDGDLDVVLNTNSRANSQEFQHKITYYLTHIWIFALYSLNLKMLKHKNKSKFLQIFYAS
jgi:hypothetical protein